MVLSNSVWIVGASHTGKTNHLVKQFSTWMHEIARHKQFYPNKKLPVRESSLQRLNVQHESAVLVMAANDDNRRSWQIELLQQPQGNIRFAQRHHWVFFQDEVILFWPLADSTIKSKSAIPSTVTS